jgi:hypothetical protein
MRTFDNFALAVPVAQAASLPREPLPPDADGSCGVSESEPACDVGPPGSAGAPPDVLPAFVTEPPSPPLLPQPRMTPAADSPMSTPANAFMTLMVAVAARTGEQALHASNDIDSRTVSSITHRDDAALTLRQSQFASGCALRPSRCERLGQRRRQVANDLGTVQVDLSASSRRARTSH